MLNGDCCKHVLIDVARNELAKTRVLKKAGSKKHIDGIWRLNKTFSDAGGVNVPQRCVVGRAEKCKRRNQSARAHTRNRREFRARACRAPPIEHARAKSAESAATRQREIGNGT